ncbi:MAG: transposase [Spirochaetes bacterium]|nr:transposase [Spirochaetota bacterium]
MSRVARIVISGCPHHVIQRGNRRQKVFFCERDKKIYFNLLHKETVRCGVEVWAYCLMDNHVHLIVVPVKEDSLARGIGETHRKYTRMINLREGWSGYLWQGRFLSYPLNNRYLYAAVRYVERNPVRAGLVKNAEDYRWSSARAHVYHAHDILLSNSFLISEIKDWASYLSEYEDPLLTDIFKKHANTGRPLGEGIVIKEK